MIFELWNLKLFSSHSICFATQEIAKDKMKSCVRMHIADNRFQWCDHAERNVVLGFHTVLKPVKFIRHVI